MPEQNLLLDPAIRDWVLLPLLVITTCFGLIRHYVALMLRSNPTVKLDTIENANLASAARLLVANGKHLSPQGYKQRAQELLTPNNLGRTVELNPLNSMSDPGMATEMLKGNLSNIPLMVLSAMASSMFSGLVVAKFPFPVHNRLRSMVLKGVELDHLDCSFVTTLSMVLLMWFGMQGILTLIIGEVEGDAMMDAGKMISAQQRGPVDYTKVFKQLKDELEFEADRYTWVADESRSKTIRGEP